MTQITKNKNRYTITKVFVLNNGTEMRDEYAFHPAQLPTADQMIASWLRPLAEEMAGEPARIMTDSVDWHQDGELSYHCPSDGFWRLTWATPQQAPDGWYLYGPGQKFTGTPLHMGADQVEAMERADLHIEGLREDPMAEEHWREEREERDYPGMLALHTNRGPVVLPVASVLYVRYEAVDNETGKPVEFQPGWPAPNDTAEVTA